MFRTHVRMSGEPKSNCCGPGYASPEEAMKGPREKVLFVTCAHAKEGGRDMLATVDVDPDSDTYCKVLSKVQFPNTDDEVHHSGWNACSSCHGNPKAKRTHIILPCLNSDRIYIVNVQDEKNIRLEKTIDQDQLKALNLSFPHTSHCLADGTIMISTLGDRYGNNKGNFLLLDGETFEPKGTWIMGNPRIAFNYDFWYQPKRDIMISTEWGNPNFIKEGFDPSHVAQGYYGNSLHFFKWSTHEHFQTIDLPMPEGAIPLEVRFHHQPTSPHAFVGVGLGSTVFHLHPETEGSERYAARCLIKIPAKTVTGWALPQMPALITDILISMNDKFLFTSNWLHGDIRQYDITDLANPRLVGQIFLGGSIHVESGVTVTEDLELKEQPPARYIKGKKVEGGPQMLQMSLDGKRLYVTTSLYRKWDYQFYPELAKGAIMLCIDVSADGGLTLNEEFLIDFGALEGGPFLGHEMRYPGGDCTSDIWI